MYSNRDLENTFWIAFEDELVKEAMLNAFEDELIKEAFNLAGGMLALKNAVQFNPKFMAQMGPKLKQLALSGKAGANNLAMKGQGFMGNAMTNPAMASAMAGGSPTQMLLGAGISSGAKAMGNMTGSGMMQNISNIANAIM